MAIRDRLKDAWNAFRSNEKEELYNGYSSGSSSFRPYRSRPTYANEKTIIASIYTRIGIDVAAISIRHIKLDDQGRYSEDLKSSLNNALTIEPNIDQGPRSFRQDIVQTLFDNGTAAIVPTDTTVNPESNAVFDIYSLRVGRITRWDPQHVVVDLYNEKTGLRKEIRLPKQYVAIVENPLFGVMNESNSTLRRLIRKLSLLDAVDEASSSGRLDLIIQLPYVVKSEARAQQAEARRKAIETQLTGSSYGIAYTDGTEKITQLNRPTENNLLAQIEYLTKMLYAQLGLTEEVMNGTADEKTMINYYNRTVEPVLESIVEAMNRTFLGPVGTRKLERIRPFRDPFKLVPVSELAEIGDKFIRNEILSKNEMRSFMGIPPSVEPHADQLQNPNMPQALTAGGPGEVAAPTDGAGVDAVQSAFDEIDTALTSVFAELGGEPQ